jgi:carboxymethylenebutenolidase
MTALTVRTAPVSDGHALPVHLIHPAGQIVGGLVLLQEIFGVNAYMRQMASEFAQRGFLVAVPELFARQEPGVNLGYASEDLAHGIRLRDGLDWDAVELDMGAAVELVRDIAPAHMKVAAQGYCLGGGLAVLAAARCRVDAAVSYYGVGVQDRLHLAREIAVPVLFHLAEYDHYCPPEARTAIDQAFADHRDVQSHLYPGVGHAFATYGRDTFDAAATELALGRTLTFLEKWITS